MDREESQPRQALELDGARILLVEDEYYIADDFRRVLSAAGATVVGPASTVESAERMVDEDAFDCAVIDLNLHGQSALSVADRLRERGKTFAIATGYGSGSIPERLMDVPRIEKPFDGPALLQLVTQLCCASVS